MDIYDRFCHSAEKSKKINQKHNDDSDEDITLSGHALRALEEFYQEKLHMKQADDTVELVEENWELSQFWYDSNTALALSEVALNVAGESGRIACISCPTIYAYIVKSNSMQAQDIYIFEYDKRFKDLYRDHYIFYNYNEPLAIFKNFKSYFDVVLVDPPYLSEECLEKTVETVKYVAKDKIILCTGAIMEELVNELFSLKPCDFQPQHKRKLGNEYKCYANFDFDKVINEMKQNKS